MSIKRPREITCQQCGKRQTVTVWETVNVMLDPEMKDEVIEQRVNVFACTGCGEELTVDISFLYNDMLRRFRVQYLNRVHMGSPEYYNHLNKDGTLAVQGIAREMAEKSGGDYLFRPHYVFSMREVAAYVVFRDLCEEYGQ